jgi:uroporphyrinogen-III synthase
MSEPRSLLLTRPRAQSEAFAAVLAAELPGRFGTRIAPLIEIAPVAGPLDLSGLQGLLFSSANGVDAFAARSADRSLPALCVGDMTAAAARAAGFTARSADGDVAALAALAEAAYRPGAGAFLHVRGRHAAGDLTGRLAAAGIPARAAEIYDQRAIELAPEAASALAGGAIDVVALFSPRTARLFADAARAGGWPLGTVVFAALSPAVAAALDGLGGQVQVAAAPTRAGMLETLARA